MKSTVYIIALAILTLVSCKKEDSSIYFDPSKDSIEGEYVRADDCGNPVFYERLVFNSDSGLITINSGCETQVVPFGYEMTAGGAIDIEGDVLIDRCNESGFDLMYEMDFRLIIKEESLQNILTLEYKSSLNECSEMTFVKI